MRVTICLNESKIKFWIYIFIALTNKLITYLKFFSLLFIWLMRLFACRVTICQIFWIRYGRCLELLLWLTCGFFMRWKIITAASHESLFSPTELRRPQEDLVLAKATLSFGLRGARKALWRFYWVLWWWWWRISELPPFENDDEKRLQKKGTSQFAPGPLWVHNI